MYDYLTNKGFSIQSDAIANSEGTMHSMTTTFTQKFKNENFAHKASLTYNNFVIMYGKNIVVKSFTDNGYVPYIRSSKPLDTGDFGRHIHAIYPALFNFIQSIKLDNISERAYKTIIQYIKPRSTLWFYNKVKDIEKQSKPIFLYSHSTKVHLDDWSCLDPKTDIMLSLQAYEKMIKCANDDIKKSIEYIEKNDPNAIVIIQADHGNPYFATSADSDFVKNKKTFGIIFAVKWPKECVYLGKEKYTPVNLFSRVFSCLSDKKPDYSKMQPDYSYGVINDKVYRALPE